MDQLQRLYQRLESLKLEFDDAIKGGKMFEDVKELHLQIKEIQKAIYERKLDLKRKGLFTEVNKASTTLSETRE
jgi:hypothetical protein